MRLQGSRVGIVFMASALVGVGFVFVLDGGGAAAPEGPPAYTFSDFRIEFPYDPPHPDIEVQPNVASVSFASHWAGDQYPGYASDCLVTFRNASGEVVGTLPFGHDNAKDGSRIVAIEGHVSQEPVAAEAECGSATYEDGPGYVKSGPARITEAKDKVDGKLVTLDHRASVDVPVTSTGAFDPALRSCELAVEKSDGTSEPLEPLDINVGPGDDILHLELRFAPEDIRDVSLTCKPFEPIRS